MIFRCLLAAVAMLLLPGCYQLGEIRPTVLREVSSLAVPVSRNATLEPRVEYLLADSIAKQLQRDGTYTIDYQDRADATLETTLLSATRYPARSLRGNVLATSEFVLIVTVEYKVVERVTGKTLMMGRVNGRTSFFVTANLQQDETQALPLAFADAAVNLTSRLSEGF